MRIEKSVTSVTWIPSEAISGMKVPFELGVADYDEPPPEGSRTSRRCAGRTGSAAATSASPESGSARASCIGPCALLGERALLEGGKRTSTLWRRRRSVWS